MSCETLGACSAPSPISSAASALALTLPRKEHFSCDDAHRNKWHKYSWKQYKIRQQPNYSDALCLQQTLNKLSSMPSIVRHESIDELNLLLTQVTHGRGFIIQAGDCAEPFDECYCEATVAAKVELLEKMQVLFQELTGQSVIVIGRICGQFAKPRSNDWETHSDGLCLPVYRGDCINDCEPSLQARKPQPTKLISAYDASSNAYSSLLTSSKGREVPIFISHEGLLLDYEACLTRKIEDNVYNTSAHMLWIGERTRHLDEAHIEYFRGIKNTVGIKVGPQTCPHELVQIVKLLLEQYPDRIVICISRMGSQNVHVKLPALIQVLQNSAYAKQVLWLCDPMHGNTIQCKESLLKTRNLSDIFAEILATIRTHVSCGSRLDGLHLETTPLDGVMECYGSVKDSSTVETIHPEHYHSRCDPRLNAVQCMELIRHAASSWSEAFGSLTSSSA